MNLATLFEQYYGRRPEAVSHAPGRLEILGNHTDYNEGFVLSAATEQATSIALARRDGTVCTLRDTALEGRTFTIDLNDLDHPAKGDWTNYIKGVLVELKRRGIAFGAFDLLLSSTVPLSRHFRLCHWPFSMFSIVPPGTISMVSVRFPFSS